MGNNSILGYDSVSRANSKHIFIGSTLMSIYEYLYYHNFIITIKNKMFLSQ